ncbi:MAG TPA: preprotein translocase subunit SecE [Terriglobales bacterium]|jgi:preprotein translocase subunit SecE
MAVEAKRMDKLPAPSARSDSFFGRVTAWVKDLLERTKTFYNDVRTEMKKVTTPSLKEVQSTTAVVIITVFLFGLYFWIIDGIIGKSIDYTLRTLSR